MGNYDSRIAYVNQFGDLCYMDGLPIEYPAVVIIPEDDMILKYGNAKELVPYLEKAAAAFDGALLFEFNKAQFSKEEIAYVMSRMMEFTATGFVKAFAEHVALPDCHEWLSAEMKRIPINVRKCIPDFA